MSKGYLFDAGDEVIHEGRRCKVVSRRWDSKFGGIVYTLSDPGWKYGSVQIVERYLKKAPMLCPVCKKEITIKDGFVQPHFFDKEVCYWSYTPYAK